MKDLGVSFHKARCFWLVGAPAFTLIFFLPYWFFLCPIIWRIELYETNPSWNSPWVYWYWIVSLVFWAVIILATLTCCKRTRRHSISDRNSDSYLFLHNVSGNFQNSSSLPLRITHHVIQPKRKECSAAFSQLSDVKINVGHTPIQVPVRDLAVVRSSGMDFAWDEDVPWFTARTRMSTFRPNETTSSIPSIVPETASYDSNLRDAVSRINSNPLLPSDLHSNGVGDDGDKQNLDLLVVEYPPENFHTYFYLTPVGTPSTRSPSPSSQSKSNSNLNLYTKEATLPYDMAVEMNEEAQFQADGCRQKE